MERKVKPLEFQLAQCGNPNAKLKSLRKPAASRAEIAERLQIKEATVSYWRKMFAKMGVNQPTLKRGRKKSFDVSVDEVNKIAEAV